MKNKKTSLLQIKFQQDLLA